MTQWELHMHLLEDGWVHQPLARAASQRRPPFCIADESPLKIWYHEPKRFTVSSEYLRCLCRAQALWEQHAVVEIHHGFPAKYYKALLQGEPAQAAA
eukprot:15461172-Alexandrium_andersonii.AAC.1